MTTKRLVMLTAALMLAAISGQAFAGTTISDNRYWPSDAHASSGTATSKPGNAFGSLAQLKPAEENHHYHGGPKSDD